LPKPVTASAFQLDLQKKSGDDFVHLYECEFCVPEKADSIQILRVVNKSKTQNPNDWPAVEGIITNYVDTVVWFKAMAENKHGKLNISDKVKWKINDAGIQSFGIFKGMFVIKKPGIHTITAKFGNFSKKLVLFGKTREMKNHENDLDVCFIERLPRLDYDGPNKGLPIEGSNVIWRAHVYNWGKAPVKVRIKSRIRITLLAIQGQQRSQLTNL